MAKTGFILEEDSQTFNRLIVGHGLEFYGNFFQKRFALLDRHGGVGNAETTTNTRVDGVNIKLSPENIPCRILLQNPLNILAT
jgi:hypothetical protein